MSGMLEKYQEFKWQMSRNAVSEDVNHLPDHVRGSIGRSSEVPWNLSPDYQRDHVWTIKQKELFVGNFIEGGLCPPIFVQRYESEQNYPEGGKNGWLDQPIEVIDGKQRIQALLDWLAGDIQAETTCGDRIKYADLDVVDRRRLRDLRITYVDMSRKDRLRFYLRLNRGGTVHSDSEIQKVRDLLDQENLPK